MRLSPEPRQERSDSILGPSFRGLAITTQDRRIALCHWADQGRGDSKPLRRTQQAMGTFHSNTSDLSAHVIVSTSAPAKPRQW
jgi:hypothetical protein